jgi:hypothetical protein
MPKRVGHELGDHKLGHVGLPGQPPLLQRHSGEIPGCLGRLGPRGKIAGRGGPIHQVADQVARCHIRQCQRPIFGMDPATRACRQEPIVAHASVLRPYRRHHSWVQIFVQLHKVRCRVPAAQTLSSLLYLAGARPDARANEWTEGTDSATRPVVADATPRAALAHGHPRPSAQRHPRSSARRPGPVRTAPPAVVRTATRARRTAPPAAVRTATRARRTAPPAAVVD